MYIRKDKQKRHTRITKEKLLNFEGKKPKKSRIVIFLKAIFGPPSLLDGNHTKPTTILKVGWKSHLTLLLDASEVGHN